MTAGATELETTHATDAKCINRFKPNITVDRR